MRTATAALLALSLLAPASAVGQEAIPFYLDGGATLPLGAIGEDWELGFNLGGGAGFALGSSVDLRADLTYSRFALDDEQLLAEGGVPAGADVEVDGGALGLFAALALLQWHLAPPGAEYRPYLLGGVGYWRETLEDITVRDATGAQTLEGGSDNGMAGALGAGFSFAVAPGLGLFLEGRYMVGWDFGDPPDLDSTYLPVKLGVVFNP